MALYLRCTIAEACGRAARGMDLRTCSELLGEPAEGTESCRRSFLKSSSIFSCVYPLSDASASPSRLARLSFFAAQHVHPTKSTPFISLHLFKHCRLCSPMIEVLTPHFTWAVLQRAGCNFPCHGVAPNAGQAWPISWHNAGHPHQMASSIQHLAPSKFKCAKCTVVTVYVSMGNSSTTCR